MTPTTRTIFVVGAQEQEAAAHHPVGFCLDWMDDWMNLGSSAENASTLALPLLEWCEIPEGTVIIESRVYRVRTFQMSKYPVTYQQYEAFLHAEDGYFNPAWWKGQASPRKSAEQRWPIPDHPREHVNWVEAVAFCRWLSHRLGRVIRLPTEQEWQRAAQGDSGRTYPWGDRYDDTSRANTRERGLNRTTPVTQFARGASQFGVFDMGGNVWEWCLNSYEHPGRIGMDGAQARVLRGGSWFSFHEVMHTAFRYFALPTTRDFDVGFRLVQAADGLPPRVRPNLPLTARYLLSLLYARWAKPIRKFLGIW